MKFALAILFLTILVATAGRSAAQDGEQALPSLHNLPCMKDCGDFTAAVPAKRPMPAYPTGNTGFAEGYVWVRFRILPDGRVDNVSAMQVLGLQDFADRAVAAVKEWTYKPATLKGTPIEINRATMITFDANGPKQYRITRPEFDHVYRNAVSDIKDGKLDEALAKVRDAQLWPKLTFYERGMLGNLGGKVAIEKKDYLQAHALTMFSTQWGLGELDPPVVQSLLQTRVESAASLGDIVDMLDSFTALKSMKGFDGAGPLAKLVADTQTKADSLPVFGMSAAIPAGGTGGYYGLYRRIFTFKGISGSLENFFLGCDQGAVESKISDNAEWRVPKSWSNCRLAVSGAPGTTFKIVQANE